LIVAAIIGSPLVGLTNTLQVRHKSAKSKVEATTQKRPLFNDHRCFAKAPTP
jgi:hypothetical protein